MLEMFLYFIKKKQKNMVVCMFIIVLSVFQATQDYNVLIDFWCLMPLSPSPLYWRSLYCDQIVKIRSYLHQFLGTNKYTIQP